MDVFNPVVPNAELLHKKGEVSQVCATHGPYTAAVYGWGQTSCEPCRVQAQNEANRVKQEAAYIASVQRAALHAISMANIPKRFADRYLSSYEPVCTEAHEAHALVTAYANNFAEALDTGRSLILCGNVGNGKTHLAIGVAHEIIKQQCYPLFVSTINAIRHIKDTWRKDSEISESRAIQDFIKPDLLILDEVGVQHGSETERLILFDIINGRYNQQKPSILISNLSLEELPRFLGKRVFDRLRESGGMAVPFTWASYRQ